MQTQPTAGSRPTAATARVAEIALFASGVAFGASTPIGRELGVWLNPVTIVALRFTCAIPFCFIGMRRTTRMMPALRRQLIPVALLFPIAVTLYTFALFHASIAVVIFGYYVANLLTSLSVGVIANTERVDVATVVAFACSLAAAACIALGQGNVAGSWLGLLLSAGSGICATALAQEQKRLSVTVDGETIALVQSCGGAALATLAAVIIADHSITQLSATGFAFGVLYGFLFFASNRLMVFGFKYGPIGLGSVLLSVEVVVGPLLALAFFGEHLSTLQVFGGVLTGCAVVATALRSRSVSVT